jgi:hypothetical protein
MQSESLLKSALENLDKDTLKKQFDERNELLIIENFLPPEIVDQIKKKLPELDSKINRNYIPGHKKGGSVSRYTLDKQLPLIGEIYHSKKLWSFFEFLAGRPLLSCPTNDPHTYALYYYTDEGDHIGYHYDTSYYQDSRYTLLLGIIDDSSCKLECKLYKNDPERETEQISLSLKPGTLVFFNGDKLYHRITHLKENEHRIALSMEFLTNTQMSKFGRFVSNMKDAIAYFGFKHVFGFKK